MATSSMVELIHRFRRCTVLRDGAESTDGQLLEDYISRHDEAALAALVWSHGPMVWGVCRRVLGNYHDAEDAFQATFLVLVRKAESIKPREMVANWLYGVARQTALKARTTGCTRKGRERQVVEMPEPAVADPAQCDELLPVLDEELSRLPDIYRVVTVLCDLEGKTRKEVARQLGVPEGTVAGRLARARVMLAKRLTRRGVALSGGALAAVLTQQGASAGVPNTVVVSTIKAARLVAAGQAATEAVSVKVAALTEGVMKAMLFNKLKAAIAVVLMLGFVATGATLLTYRTAAGQADKKPVAEKPVEPTVKQEKEAFTAWGKEVDGLQAGLGFRPGEKRAYQLGETVTLVVRVRNVGKEAVKFRYVRQFFLENPPVVTDDKDKSVPLERVTVFGFHALVPMDLAPGKEIEIGERQLELKPTLYGTGKFSVQYERLETPENDKTLSKLATGKLELEVKSNPPPAAEKKDPQKQEKEGFTAWGKEVGGLQAGLGFRPGERRAYHHNETVTLVVRVRNVGKEEVKFSYYHEDYRENPPAVTDDGGMRVPLEGGPFLKGLAKRIDVTLAPGKTVDLCEMSLSLRPADEKGKEAPVWKLFGTGKFQLQCGKTGGNIQEGNTGPDPIRSKLDTGKLELEVRSGPPPAAAEKK